MYSVWDIGQHRFSPEIIHLFSSDNSFVCVMVVSWQLLSQSLIPLSSVYSRGTRYPPHNLLWPHHRGLMSQELKKQTCCMRSQPHERSWPPLLKLNLEMVGKLVSAAIAVAKSQFPIFNSNSNIKLGELRSQRIGTSDNVSALSWTAPPWLFIHCGSSMNIRSLIYN